MKFLSWFYILKTKNEIDQSVAKEWVRDSVLPWQYQIPANGSLLAHYSILHTFREASLSFWMTRVRQALLVTYTFSSSAPLLWDTASVCLSVSMSSEELLFPVQLCAFEWSLQKHRSHTRAGNPINCFGNWVWGHTRVTSALWRLRHALGYTGRPTKSHTHARAVYVQW